MRCSPQRPVRCHSTNSSSFPTYWADSSQERSSAHVRQGRGAGGGHPADLGARIRGDLAGRADGGHGYPSGQPVRGVRRQEGALQEGRRRVTAARRWGPSRRVRWPRRRRLAAPCPGSCARRRWSTRIRPTRRAAWPSVRPPTSPCRTRRSRNSCATCATPVSPPSRLRRAEEEGELPAGTDTSALASYFATIVQGFSQRARDGADTDELSRVAELARVAWPSGD